MPVSQLCKYSIDDIGVIFKDGSTATILKTNVTAIMIEKDYHNDFFPIFSVDVVLPSDLQVKIRDNNESVRCRVRLNRFLVRNDNDIGNKKYLKPYIDDVFQIALSDVSPVRSNLDKKVPGYDDSPQRDSSQLTLYLFKQGHIDRFKPKLNFILQSASVGETIIHAAHKVGVDKILISDPDNFETYDQIIMSPHTFKGLVEYLQNVYGIYKKGYMLFNDFDIMYMINKEIRCTAYRVGEAQRVYIHVAEKDTPHNSDIGGYTDDAAHTHHFNTNNKPTITSKSKEIQDTLFDTLTVVNSTKGTVATHKVNLGIPNKGSLEVLDNRYDNTMAVTSLLYSLEETNTVVDITLNEPDLDVLTPNKEFYLDLKLDNTYRKYCKTYKLHKFMALMQRANGAEYFTCNAACQLKSD